ncbi:hypothetical protein C0Q70_18608 [Pomacea canaliculata]|uniref:Uncharacterized protein n=1 Tax=Pomacea canaliculata TaxID=400727 RepID=A0A2T7NH40_POMCA|nr:hypothetical protein C0Q70_18608 [Pomacea canaliculata]
MLYQLLTRRETPTAEQLQQMMATGRTGATDEQFSSVAACMTVVATNPELSNVASCVTPQCSSYTPEVRTLEPLPPESVDRVADDIKIRGE